jgi:hypothetical protein
MLRLQNLTGEKYADRLPGLNHTAKKRNAEVRPGLKNRLG